MPNNISPCAQMPQLRPAIPNPCPPARHQMPRHLDQQAQNSSAGSLISITSPLPIQLVWYGNDCSRTVVHGLSFEHFDAPTCTVDPLSFTHHTTKPLRPERRRKWRLHGTAWHDLAPSALPGVHVGLEPDRGRSWRLMMERVAGISGSGGQP